MMKKILLFCLFCCNVSAIVETDYFVNHYIQGSSYGPLNDYQIKIVLRYGAGTSQNDTIFCNSHCNGNFQDVRFYDSTGNDYLYYRDLSEYIPGNKCSFIVKIDSIPPFPDSIKIKIGYGGLSNTTSSLAAFAYTDSCMSTSAAGIWDTVSGSGSVSYTRLALFNSVGWAANGGIYQGPSGTYTDRHRPMAWRDSIDDNNDKTFFVWSGETLGFGGDLYSQCNIAYYDHVFKTFSMPKCIGTIITSADPHANPSITIDKGHNIYISYGSHNSTMSTIRSTVPNDISNWTAAASIPSHTYPQMWPVKKNKLIHFYRGSNYKGCYRTSIDSARTYSSETIFIDFGNDTSWVYMMTEPVDSSFIHIFWTIYYSNQAKRMDYYYAKYNCTDSTFYKSDGTPYSLPITKLTAEEVFNTGSFETTTEDLSIDEEGNPYMLGGIGSSITHIYNHVLFRLQSGSWIVDTICTSDHQFDIGGIVVNSKNNIHAYIPKIAAQYVTNGGKIVHYFTSDSGNTWSIIDTLTKNTLYSHNWVRHVHKGKNDFQIYWCYGDASMTPVPFTNTLWYYGENNDSAMMIGIEKQTRNNLLWNATAASNNVIRSVSFTDTNYIFECYFIPLLSTPTNAAITVRQKSNGNCYWSKPYSTAPSYSKIYLLNPVVQIGSNGTPISTQYEWNKLSFTCFKDSLKLAVNNTVTIPFSVDSRDSCKSGGIGFRNYQSRLRASDIRVSKYVQPEPSHLIYSGEYESTVIIVDSIRRNPWYRLDSVSIYTRYAGNNGIVFDLLTGDTLIQKYYSNSQIDVYTPDWLRGWHPLVIVAENGTRDTANLRIVVPRKY